MRRPELDQILTTMLALAAGGVRPAVHRGPAAAGGSLRRTEAGRPAIRRIEKLTPFQTEIIALNIIGDNLWQIEDLLRHGSCDASYALSDKARFRVNIFSQRGNYSIVCRKLNTSIPDAGAS